MRNYRYKCKSSSELEESLIYLKNKGFEDTRICKDSLYIVAVDLQGWRSIDSFNGRHYQKLAYECKSLADFKEFVNCMYECGDLKSKLIRMNRRLTDAEVKLITKKSSFKRLFNNEGNNV